MRFIADVDIDDIAVQVDHDEGAELIKAIDLQMADFEFTVDMAKYFVGEVAKEYEADGKKMDLSKFLS